MSIQVFQANLIDALKQLNIRWRTVRERWDDSASQKIQAELVDSQEAMIRSAVQSLNHVADLMASARRECSDDS